MSRFPVGVSDNRSSLGNASSKYKPNMGVGICLNDFAEMQTKEPPAWLVGAFNHSYLVRAW